MNTLGWIIWGLGFLFLLNGIRRLVKRKKRRVARSVFCLITASALVATATTSFSKFHLLWIIPLPLLAGLLGFGLIASIGVTHHKLTARKPEKTVLPAGSFPPFGKLEWTSYDWWEGEMKLPAWSGFQSRRGGYNSQDSESPADGTVEIHVNPGEPHAPLEPTAAQCRAMDFQIQHGEAVVNAVLAALMPYYLEMKKEWDLDDELMPPVKEPAEFCSRMGLGVVHVLPHEKEGVSYVGLEIGCDWEEEHGLGVVLLKDRVVEIADGEIAFSWAPPGKPELEGASAE
jgi:hypothetical protein